MKLLKVSVLLCVLISAGCLFAQVSGSISGIVTDSTGAVVAGAKTVRVTDRFRMQIRSEFFNVLNHAQLRQPSNVIENPGTLDYQLPR